MKVAAALCLLLASMALGADTIASAEAKDHVGQEATVCGKVTTTRYLESSAKKPTFLNFDKPYPEHTFTAVIFGEHRAKFGTPDETYRDKSVCVTGKIELYNGKPQIEITEPKQIRLDSK